MEPFPPRPLDGLLATYGESHLHPTNEVIHFVCVTVIAFSLLGLACSGPHTRWPL